MLHLYDCTVISVNRKIEIKKLAFSIEKNEKSEKYAVLIYGDNQKITE